MNRKLAIGLSLSSLVFLWVGVSIYPDWLWFENLGFFTVFWTTLLSKFGVGLAAWLVFILIVFLNLFSAKLSTKRVDPKNCPRVDHLIF
ncbi:MAG: hypothetical protein GTO13_03725 [Proteobacteria bacterium]|nr:hypothetical protein [Pseudomonadota bacterium]